MQPEFTHHLLNGRHCENKFVDAHQRLRFVLTILALYKFVCMYVCMRSRVRVTVGYSSVCPVDRQQQRRAAGLLLSALRAGDIDIDRQLRERCGRRAAGAGSKCGQRHVEIRRRRLSTDLLSVYNSQINLPINITTISNQLFCLLVRQVFTDFKNSFTS